MWVSRVIKDSIRKNHPKPGSQCSSLTCNYMYQWPWEHCLRPLGLCSLTFPSFLTELEHSLMTHVSHWGLELELLWKTPLWICHGGLWSIAENGLVKRQWPILLVNQPNGMLKACALERLRANVTGESCVTADGTALHTDHQKMVPLPVFGSFLQGAPGSVMTKV